MFEVRIHGRGGQGVVTAAELLAMAAFREGRYAQAVPSFGSERTGAPVVAFCRVDDAEIRSHEPVLAPDAVIVQDPTLLHQVDVTAGMAAHAYLLVNSARTAGELGIASLCATLDTERVAIVPATEIARETTGRPVPNAVLLGGFAALTYVVSLDSISAAIRERFAGAVADGNIAGAAAAFRRVRATRREVTRAAPA